MFNNLIESTSHRNEFKRRGSFMLLTIASYAFLFVITGVASIYAYDAQLGEQTYEITWLPAVNLTFPESPHSVIADRARSTENVNRSSIPERAVAMLSVNDPGLVPTAVSATPNKNLPLPPGPYQITGRDRGPISAGVPGPAIIGNRISTPTRLEIDAGDPPPTPVPPPAKRVINTSRVLNSEALYLPKPNYPLMAKQIRIQGSVAVQVLIDEKGNVISAKAVSGHPLLVIEAQRAAMQARFSPTILGDHPVKVSGLITYNFVMQ